MSPRTSDPADLVPFSRQVDRTRVPSPNDYLIERHVPKLFDTPYHHHASVEINFLQGCEMRYSFSGDVAALRSNRLTVFWGAAPHRVAEVRGQGQITNIYLSLGQFVRWGLPTKLVDAILGGAVICATSPTEDDVRFFDRLFAERDRKSAPWRRTHLAEIETRLRRLALESWETLLSPRDAPKQVEITGQAMLRVEAMLRCIADNFTIPINVDDIARAANLSSGRAGKLFRRVMGVSIKQHLMRARLSHARMLLTETDAKVASVALDSGFPSLSAFYEAFGKGNGMSPAAFRKSARMGNPFLAVHGQLQTDLARGSHDAG